ncbi:hypothetical protein M8J77_012046 [Diaphorina citri]|nr:hypothetical protein M8J77_012046 [Diaphorina citri]
MEESTYVCFQPVLVDVLKSPRRKKTLRLYMSTAWKKAPTIFWITILSRYHPLYLRIEIQSAIKMKIKRSINTRSTEARGFSGGAKHSIHSQGKVFASVVSMRFGNAVGETERAYQGLMKA